MLDQQRSFIFSRYNRRLGFWLSDFSHQRLILADRKNGVLSRRCSAIMDSITMISAEAYEDPILNIVSFLMGLSCPTITRSPFYSKHVASYRQWGKGGSSTLKRSEEVTTLMFLFRGPSSECMRNTLIVKISKQPSRFDGNNKRNAPTASSNGARDRRGPPPPRRDSVRREGLPYQRRGGPAPLYPRKAPAYVCSPPPLRRSIMMAPPPYDRPPVDDYYYRRDPLLAPPREHIFRDVEMRPVEYHDPFSMRGEPIPFQYSTYSAAVPPPSAYAPPHHMYRY